MLEEASPALTAETFAARNARTAARSVGAAAAVPVGSWDVMMQAFHRGW
jgi:hypothetical protein